MDVAALHHLFQPGQFKRRKVQSGSPQAIASRSGNETVPDARVRNGTRFALAEETISPPRECTVAAVTDRFRYPQEQPQERPQAAEIPDDAQHGVRLLIVPGAVHENNGFEDVRTGCKRCHDLRADLGLRRNESKQTATVAPDYEPYPAVAEIAQAIEDDDHGLAGAFAPERVAPHSFRISIVAKIFARNSGHAPTQWRSGGGGV
jgi:hypothetical protein